MRIVASVVLCILIYTCILGQAPDTYAYSQSESNGVIIQNSFPKGGPYTGRTTEHYNYSQLVFFSRVINETENSLELNLEFSADPIPIPDASDTYVKLFLPPDTMTFDKQSLFNYGVTELESFDESTSMQRKLNPGEDCLFYVVAIFYQTKEDAWQQNRGGNRAELVLEGQDLYYKMLPQVENLPCGQITFDK